MFLVKFFGIFKMKTSMLCPMFWCILAHRLRSDAIIKKSFIDLDKWRIVVATFAKPVELSLVIPWEGVT